jgi:hypothetical protein
MAKTRSQAAKSQIKKEEDDEEYKNTLLLNSVSNRTRSRSKITKRRSPMSNSTLLPTRQVKLEEGMTASAC